MELEEIRVNRHYSTHSVAEYKDGEKNGSLPIINKRTMRTDELLDKLQANAKFMKQEYKVDHLFPPNCRYFEQHEQGFFVVIEEPPAFRTIAVDKDMSMEIESLRVSGKLKEYGYENWQKENPLRPYMFNLAMPYVTFFLTFTKHYDLLNGSVFFRTKPISGFSDPICKAPLLNISDSQNICFGHLVQKGPHKSIFSDTNYVIGSFWSTIYNSDYIYNYVAYQEVAGVCDYLTWEYYSHVDPMFIYKVDWLQYDKKNVGQVIDGMKARLTDRESDDSSITYNSLSSLFSLRKEKGLAEVPGLKGVQEPLIYDVSQYFYLGRQLYINVGDSFKINKNQYVFVDSFLGFRKSPDPSFINLQREDGRIFKWKLNNKVIKYLSDKIKEERFINNVELPNGVILKSGDILVMKNGFGQDVYRKINYIRKTANDVIEGSFGSDFYVVDNLPNDCKVLDLSNPEYMGMKLNTNKEYFVIRGHSYLPGPVINVCQCKFSEITTGSNYSLVVKLIESQGSNQGYVHDINLINNTERKIFDIKEIKELPPVFRLGRRLVYARYGRDDTPVKAYAIPHLGVALPYNVTTTAAPFTLYRDTLVKDDAFHLEASDLNLDFKIGDKVVVANWRDPLDMLTVKQIEGFVIDSNNGDIKFIMKDKNDKLYEHIYITHRNSCVKIGSVRKITNVYGDLSAGTKIVAREAGISMFPKKDTNIIIGFLYDTGGEEPLVLCSNACTLWYNDVLEKFDHIPMSDKNWGSIAHTPINTSKMRFQAGDVIRGVNYYTDSQGYLAYRPRISKTIRAQQLQYYGRYEESFAFDSQFTRDVIFDTIPNPRISGPQETSLGFIPAFPNFHGMFTETSKYFSPFLFANDPRSMIYVSNNSE